MAENPLMPFWTDAYLGDTKHLTTIEHGAYLLLLITMWRTKSKSLPDDDRLLARYTGLTARQWQRMKPIIEPFFDVENGVWTQGRLTDEANAVRRYSKKQSDRSKARWLKTKKPPDAVGVPQGIPDACSLPLSPVSTEANASGAEAPNLSEVLFGPCLEWLTGKGVAEKQARSLLGKWRKLHGDEPTLMALRRCWTEGASEPVAFCEGIFKANGKSKGKADERFERVIGFASGSGRRAETVEAVAGDPGQGSSEAWLPAGDERSRGGNGSR